MTILHSTANSYRAEPDIHTAKFMYRFADKNNEQHREYVEADDDVSAQLLVGERYVFTARFRQEVTC